MNRQDARFVIECLRAGIAAGAVSELFTQGQGRVVAAFQEHLDAGAGALALEGGYGQGKTHLLKHLAHLARRRGYVVSHVTLSKETPFHHWWHLYAGSIGQAELPDAPHEPPVAGVLKRLKWGQETAERLHAFNQELHPRLSALLRAYYESPDAEAQHRLAGDLAGHALTNSALGKVYKAATGERVRLPAARLAQTGRDYFQMMGRLFQAAGYAGWVVLFDEFELVCKLSALQRARAYANLAAFLRPEPLPGLERTVVVAAFIPAMVSDFLLGGKCDLQALPQALRSRGLEEDAAGAESAIRWLLEKKHSLALLGETETLDVLDRIAGLHEEAYAWKRRPEWGRFYAPSSSAAERMRTRVRFCVEALDLAHLYGEPPTVRSREIALPRLAEDAEFYSTALEEPLVEEVDR